MLAKLFFNQSDPDDETMGEAVWLYGDLAMLISNMVCNGIGKAFSKNS